MGGGETMEVNKWRVEIEGGVGNGKVEGLKGLKGEGCCTGKR